MSTFAQLLTAVLTEPGPQLDRTDVEGLTVSTVHTTDMGCETALLDAKSAHPVERYGEDREAALEGHAKWVAWARDRTHTTVTKLGYGDLIPPVTITLQRGV